MKHLITFFIKRPKLVNLLVIFIFLSGFISMIHTQNKGYPDVDFGMVNVHTIYPGGSAEDIELKITNKIEESLIGISGIDFINSASIENLSIISILLEDNADYVKVKNDIQKAVDNVQDLPTDLPSNPVITEVNNDRIPVAEVALVGKMPFKEKRKYAESLESKLRSDSLIGKVDKVGYLKREVKVKIDAKKLQKEYVSIASIMSAIQQHNIRLSAGDLQSGKNEKTIVVRSEFETIKQVENVVIRSGFDGNRVIVSDIAQIEDGFEDPDIITRVNGKESINLILYKKEKADIIDTSRRIKTLLAEFETTIPEGLEVKFVVDYSVDVTNLLTLVKNNAKMGLILVLLALFVFLNARVAVWTALGIPSSVLFAFALFSYFNVSLNFISLMAMIIVLGMLVDDAIVVSENIFRYREKGMDPEEAAIKGTSEVMWPVISTVLTTMVAFTPLIAMTGIMGKFMRELPIVINLILLGSLLECLFILPSHIAHAKIKKSKFSLKPYLDKLGVLYSKFVLITLHNKVKTVITFIAIFIFSIVLLATSMKFILFDSDDSTYGWVRFETPIGMSVKETAKLSAQIEKILLAMPKEEIKSFVLSAGQKTPSIASHGFDLNHGAVGNVVVHLTNMEDRKRVAKEIMAEINTQVKTLKGFTEIEAKIIEDGPPVGKPITLTLISNNNKLRSALAQLIKEFLEAQKGVFDLVDSEGTGKDRVQIRFDYDLMSRLGLMPSQVATAIRTAYEGTIVTNVRQNGEEVDYRVIMADTYRKNIDTLKTLTVENKDGKLIPLAQLIHTKETTDVLMLNHYDGDRSITIYGDVDTEIVTSLEINKAIEKEFGEYVKSQPDIRWVFGGEEKDTQESMKSLGIAMIMALIGIYFILVILFNSFTQPFLVMSSIPFTFSGIIFAFFIHNITFGFTAILGLIGLTGIVVNNSLIMISMMNNQVAEEGWSLNVIAEAAQLRLRPILLTTATTAAGLFPTAYGLGGENAFLTPMIMAIAWGLIFATVITLFLVPSLYVLHYKVGKKINSLFKK